MEDFRNILKHIKGSILQELSPLIKLESDKLKTFKDVFNLEFNVKLYYNDYNVAIIDEELHDELKSFFKKGSLLLKVEIPEHNTYLWVYQYFNDQIFESYLADSTTRYNK